MLNPATAGSLARGGVRRTTLFKPGTVLRFALAVTAMSYVLGPTLAQWISFDSVRAEVAALREAPVPVDGREGEPTVSAEVQSMLEDVAPENVKGLVGPGLSALGTLNESTNDFGSYLLSSAIRAAQVAALAFAAVIVGLRSTVRYKPKHGAGWLSVLMGRSG